MKSHARQVRDRDTAVVRRAAALLLDYPDRAFFERLPGIRAAVLELPRGGPRTALDRFCSFAASTPELELAAHYVETFDMRRRRALHMTFYTDGDTRRRGHTLARLKEVYAGCGWRPGPQELPDHLSVLLEFAARGDSEWGRALLVRFQPGLELLRAGLHEHGTPYAEVVDAVAATLPPPAAAQRAEARRLAEQGPPAEDVGLEPYGAAGGDGAAGAAGPVQLGMPAMGAPAPFDPSAEGPR
ncbi:nitrate reductase molybdenum cofactor assembly chaperone [Nocardiopsis potens]|uniref:nitrate reductase molybdenum cofactor assembly chaperone n=1 Tax=Nocardiopsis potens TaxID=1246458 RepID=UPI00034AF3F2|nr:nitrate reductase molybdenum cofactor assembly chaperone [Nocardiopsis potens]